MNGLRVLIAPAHWGGRTHEVQLWAIAAALASHGHNVTFVTASLKPPVVSSLHGVEVVVVESVKWPAALDLQLALRISKGLPEWEARVELVSTACAAAERFFADEKVKAQLLSKEFDVVLVDAGALCGHLLADAMHPLTQVHFLCYPQHPRRNRKTDALYNHAVQRRVGARLHALRASLGAPPKPQCARCHVLTLVGHSRPLHGRAATALFSSPALRCVGSVSSSGPIPALPGELDHWAEVAGASGGFIVCSLGTWGDAACSELGKDEEIATALRGLGTAVIWKTRYSSSASYSSTVRTAAWLPQRALVAHRHCRLLVCHGGANSISEACASAVPIVSLPIAYDQPENTSLIEELGVGIGLPLVTLTADALLTAVRDLLADGERPRRAATLAEAIRSSDTGASGAVDLIERAVVLRQKLDAAGEDWDLGHGRTAPRGDWQRQGQQHGHECNTSTSVTSTCTAEVAASSFLARHAAADEDENGWGDSLD
jgi:hypothetical protein